MIGPRIEVNTCVLSSFSGLFAIAISVQKPPETGVANLRPVGLASALRALSLGYAKRESEALQHFAHALSSSSSRSKSTDMRDRAFCSACTKKTRVVDGPLAYYCSGQEPRTSPEYVPPGGTQTPTLGQASVYEVDDQTSSNPTVSRGSLAPPRHPRRGRGSGWVNVSMNNGILGLILAHPCMGGENAINGPFCGPP